MREENEISRKIIGATIEVHKVLGPGLLESAYEIGLERELKIRRLNVQRQVALPLVYKGEKCDIGYRIDLFVEDKVIVENSLLSLRLKVLFPIRYGFYKPTFYVSGPMRNSGSFFLSFIYFH